jgi:D-aspartate ligase
MSRATGPLPGALIIGGAHVSLAIARSLGRHGVPVWLMANHPLPRYSRYVARSFAWPGADDRAGVSSIIDVVTRHGLRDWVLIATGDQDMAMVAQNHAALSAHLKVATPDWQTARWSYDKHLTYQRAAELGIDFPKSYQPHDAGGLARLDCRFPVVLKPAYRKGNDEFTLAKAWKADDRDALVAQYARAAALVGADAIIVQEWIPGAGEAQFSYAGLWQNGSPIASLVARRTRQHPIDFGRSSTFVETIDCPEVESLAARFLKSLDYTGVVEIEFKRDRRDGRYRLLDVNGRFWAWCALGHAAGIDFPYLVWKQALGESSAPCHGKPGIAWMHGSRDIIAAWQEMRRGTLRLRDYLRALPHTRSFATFALDDPLPALMEIPVAVANKWFGDYGRVASASAPNTVNTSGLRSRL